MRYQNLSIQTQREAPNNARSQGFSFLVRAGYMTRDAENLPLGDQAIQRLQSLAAESGGTFFSKLSLATVGNDRETFFPLSTGPIVLLHCPACGYTDRKEWAERKKSPFPPEELSSLEKVLTPGCDTIEELSNFLEIPTEKTAKALMFTRLSDGKFIMAIVRGDMQISEAKLEAHTGKIRAATEAEIIASGATPGFASPIGLQNALIAIDNLIQDSPNLVAGANDKGYHLKNVNHGRDYQAEIKTDLAQAQAGDPCARCGKPMAESNALLMATRNVYEFSNILLALAESNYGEKGLSLPPNIAPFNVYLMHVPGKTIDTKLSAEELYSTLQNAGISVLFDDRDERAGVKFNDADLIGLPFRITVGERGLQNNQVEIKARNAADNLLVSLGAVVDHIRNAIENYPL